MIIVNMPMALIDEQPLGISLLENNPFIHASTPELFHRVLPKLIDKTDLAIILIDETKLESLVKYEDKNNNQLFYPHIYGPINRAAILSIHPFVVKDGQWIPPAGIASDFEF